MAWKEKKITYQKDLQNQNQNSLYTEVNDTIPSSVRKLKNRHKSWVYGYDEKYDIVVISRDGTIGDIYNINNLKVALPHTPKDPYKRSTEKASQYWEASEYSKELKRISTIFQWHNMPLSFKERWVDYIEKEFNRRDLGYWFYNNGVPTYITGSHYMYLQWTKIDVGLPDFREANRVFYIYWEACKADKRSFGQKDQREYKHE